ncbi:beta-ketoacyl-[acyl-carrier-protein] synthase family protein [Pelosinus baikalensis]|uniref:Ketosynthase family 3 (KS3) domain-containing protein n=1 Tax=Pelosinus baikalensis TaxID=2892015 RepID=A0ABS8HTK2_9FIRM|nr:beta-ketoacyl synthase N-terminal-like domain-containing protein [Pelosinus baikalensis]MCC5466503.1 hypothetical protein [Pelosinus baikalensis]
MENRKDGALITGIGVLSPYGSSVDEFWNGLKAGKNVEKELTRFKDLGIDHPSGVEACLPLQFISPEERILYMGEKAIASAILDWGGDLNGFKRITLVVGSGLGLADQLYFDSDQPEGCKFLSTLADKLALRTGINCNAIFIGNACSAGSQAISYGKDLLDLDDSDLVIAGGIEMLSQMAYAGFIRLKAIDSNGCRPFDRDRKGIMVGEGAVFFVLEKSKKIVDERDKAYCLLSGAGVTSDAYHIVQIKQDGTEIMRGMDEALSAAGLTKSDVDMIVAHGTGTVQNDKIESEIIRKYFDDHLLLMCITAPKSAIGHTGGASGAFGVLVAVGAILSGIIPPTFNSENIDPECWMPLVYGKYTKRDVRVVMVNAFAFGGSNVIIICEKCNAEEKG